MDVPCIRVRPFCERFSRGSLLPLLQIRGAIEGERYVVSVDSGEVLLPIEAKGVDDMGEYALLREARFDVRGGLKLRLCAVRHGDSVLGAQLTLSGTELDSRGMPRSSFTVFFGPHGMVDGQAVVRPASERPTTFH